MYIKDEDNRERKGLAQGSNLVLGFISKFLFVNFYHL